jgi:fructose-bisphosphate aldolase class I
MHRVYLIRHGETEWSLNGKHTGLTDISLTENGRAVARRLKPILGKRDFALVLSSPLRRARETCELAGFADRAEIDDDLKEWNYGDYEGLTSAEIREKRPGWLIFNDGAANGETPEQVAARVDRVIAKVRAVNGNSLLFAHGHLFRLFGARWLGLPPACGAHFLLDTSTLTVLSYYRGIPAIKGWNAPVASHRQQKVMPIRHTGGQPMNTKELETTAKALVAGGMGVLAADETPETLTKRFVALHIESTPDNRRAYREMLFATPGINKFISGVIMQDETSRQTSSNGISLIKLIAQQGMIPGIKVDMGAKPLAGWPNETVTEGLDNLRFRLLQYTQLGARFAKWRAVIRIGNSMPSMACILANAHALARYAALCQEQDVVPIVEPEVLMDGPHSIERCEEVTDNMLHATFSALFEQRVHIEGMLLKPNMIISGKQDVQQASVRDVAQATLRCLQRHAPAVVPGIVFLSGGQDHVTATAHLNAINQLEGPKPWKLGFSFGRALQDEAMQIWLGKTEKVRAAQAAFAHRAMCVSAAALGKYSESMEQERAA